MMGRLLWFSLPFDFMRIFWIVTPNDFAAALYLLGRAFSGRLSKPAFLIFAVCVLPILTIIALSGIKNSFVLDQHAILMVGISISAGKGFVLIDYIDRYRRIDLSTLALGFFAINVISLVLLIQGGGVSGSGRAQGLLNQSNAFGVMQTFSFALAISIISHRKMLSISLMLFSVFLVLASGSRGALVSFVIITLLYFALTIRLNKSGIFILGVALFFASSMVFIDFFTLLQLFERLDFAGSQRAVSFINGIILNDINFGTEFQEARGSLNRIAFQAFLDGPSLLGVGYGESGSAMNTDARPHNIILSSLVELGALGALYFGVILICAAYFATRLSFAKKENIWILLFFFCFCLTAMRTPFYFLAGIPWFVIFTSIYFAYTRNRVSIR